MTLQHRVHGTPPRAATVQLDPDQALWTSPGRIVWTTASIEVASDGGRPGLADDPIARMVEAGRRWIGGGSAAVRWARASQVPGLVTIADPDGGELAVLELAGGAGWLVDPAAIVAAESSVTVGPAFGATAGFERLAGTGTLVLAGGEQLLRVDPGDFGGRIAVAVSRLVAHELTVRATSDGVGVLALHGPGTVLLRTARRGEEASGTSPAPEGGFGMDLLGKAREAAERASALAKQGLAQGQERLDEMQSQRRGNDLMRALGQAYWAEQREGASHEAVVRALAALDAHVAEHGPVTPPPPPSAGGPTAGPDGGMGAGAPTPPPPPPPPPGESPSGGSTLGDLR